MTEANVPAPEVLPYEKQAELAAGYEMGDSVQMLAKDFGVSEDYARECIAFWRDTVAAELEKLRLEAEERRVGFRRPRSPLERMIDDATGYRP